MAPVAENALLRGPSSPSMARKLKCVFVGDGAVGKTSLIVSYTTNGYPQEYVPTAFDNYSVLVRVDNQPVRLQLCDTAGQNDFDSLRPLCYPETDVFLLCFSTVSPTSFYNLAQHWVPELKQHAANTPILLIGTQIDLRCNVQVLLELDRYGETPVSEAEGNAYAREMGATSYIECSALTQQNLKEVFDASIMAALSNECPKSSASHEISQKSFKKLRQKLAGSATSDEMEEKEYRTETQSAVMVQRQHSNSRLAKVEPPPSALPKFSKLREGWRRLLCFAKRVS